MIVISCAGRWPKPKKPPIEERCRSGLSSSRTAKLGNYRLTGCDLYVTLEPCPMCLGAVVQARVRRLVYGAPDLKSGAVRSVMQFPFRKLNYRPDIVAGVLADDCGRLLRDFFGSRR
jgi:tRNA(adenine34) deaminase